MNQFEDNTIFVARIVSAITSPVITLVVLSYLIVKSLQLTKEYFLISFACFCLVPAVVSFCIFFFRGISNLNVPKREDRNIFYLAFLVSSLLGLIVLRYAGAPLVILVVGVLAICVAGVALFINAIFIKVSLHCLSYCSLGVFLLLINNELNSYFAIMLLVFSSSLVIWSRLKLKYHTQLECIIGAMLGFAFSFSFWLIVN